MMTDKLSVLIVDSNRTNLALMDMMVRKLPNCATQLKTDPASLFAHCGDLHYDLAVFAAGAGSYDSVELARVLRAQPHLRDKPILMAADEPDAVLKARARDAGVADVLNKPIDPVEFRARIQSLVRLADVQASMAAPAGASWGNPEVPVEISAREEEFLATLVRVAGYKDRETPLHGQRVARYCAILAHHLGMTREYCRDIRLAAPLHDIGKAGLSDALLRKTGFLTPEEKRELEQHTHIGHALLSGTRSSVFRMAADIALTHHERWDGSGYPQGLRGEQIPLAGRIAAVADIFDALTSVRSYKTAWTLANAYSYLHENAGEQFDPSCVAAFENGREEISAVMQSMSDVGDDGDAADAA